MGHPISSEDGQDTPGPREGSGWPPGPTSPRGIALDKVASGFRGLVGGRTTPGGLIRTEEDKNANAGARRQKTWAPRRRTGSWSSSVGVSAHYLHLSYRMIATTHGPAWRRSGHVSFMCSGRGVFPPKTPPLPLWISHMYATLNL